MLEQNDLNTKVDLNNKNKIRLNIAKSLAYSLSSSSSSQSSSSSVTSLYSSESSSPTVKLMQKVMSNDTLTSKTVATTTKLHVR